MSGVAMFAAESIANRALDFYKLCFGNVVAACSFTVVANQLVSDADRDSNFFRSSTDNAASNATSLNNS